MNREEVAQGDDGLETVLVVFDRLGEIVIVCVLVAKPAPDHGFGGTVRRGELVGRIVRRFSRLVERAEHDRAVSARIDLVVLASFPLILSFPPLISLKIQRL